MAYAEWVDFCSQAALSQVSLVCVLVNFDCRHPQSLYGPTHSAASFAAMPHVWLQAFGHMCIKQWELASMTTLQVLIADCRSQGTQ